MSDAERLRIAQRDAERELALPAPSPFISSQCACSIDEIADFIRRYVVLGDNELFAVALWVIHSHAIDAAYSTPYLSIGSPQKQCGKSQLLEVLDLLVARPWLTARTSAAALVRKIAKDAPTLLLDETDAAFGGEKEYSEALRGILNAGHRRGNVVTLCVGAQHDVADFPVFCPKAFAGIGALPDTVADRSIRIELRRRAPTEHIERFRQRRIKVEASALRDRIASWVKESLEALRAMEPALPNELSDRAADGWEPLLAIADSLGRGDYARHAAIALASSSDTAPEDVSLRTLRDLRDVFAERRAERLSSAEIVEALRQIDDGPYGFSRGRDFNAIALARRLRPYGIKPVQFRDGEEVRRGYAASQFSDTWTRYADPGLGRSQRNTQKAVTSVTGVTGPSNEGFQRDELVTSDETKPLALNRVTGDSDVTAFSERGAEARQVPLFKGEDADEIV